MDGVTLLAPAKLNLTLDVTGVRGDGYHTMDMLMQAVSLYERVTVRRAEELRVSAPGAALPLGPKNVAWKAAVAFFQQTGLLAGAEIRLEKHAPVRAGMGGGSADGDQTGPHPGCTVCAVSGSRLFVFLWNGDYHAGLPEEDAGKDVQPHAGFADQVF